MKKYIYLRLQGGAVYSTDKKAIAEEAGFTGGWQTMRKLLEERGYRIEEKRIKNKRTHIISK